MYIHCDGIMMLQRAKRKNIYHLRFLTLLYHQQTQMSTDLSLTKQALPITVHVERREEVAVTCVVLYLLYRECCIIGEETDTGVPEFVELDMRKIVLVKQLSKIMRYAVRCYKHSDSVHANKVLVSVSLPYHNLLLRFQSFEVIIEGVVHSEAADAAVSLEHSLKAIPHKDCAEDAP